MKNSHQTEDRTAPDIVGAKNAQDVLGAFGALAVFFFSIRSVIDHLEEL
jgi:hypothetical protein